MTEVPNGQHPDEVIETIHVIKNTLDTVNNSLREISEFGKRTRRITLALIFSLVLDIVLTIVVGLLSANALSTSNTTAAETAAIRAVQHTQCLAGNEQRAENKQLWQFFLALATRQPSSSETPAQKAASAAAIKVLNHEINVTFAPRKCPFLA